MRRKKTLCVVVLIVLFFSAFTYLFIIKGIPDVRSLKTYHAPGTRVYAFDGTLIGEFRIQRGKYVRLKDVSPNLINAVIATEDARFFQHMGIDYVALIRALAKDIFYRRFKEGGSTITQQLAKLLYLSHEKTLRRKLREVVIAIMLERNLTKKEILELYLNRAYFGSGAYGVETASRTYFGKRAGDLTVKEAALIAGLLKAPGFYSPFRDIRRADLRARVVLGRMEKEGYLKPSERKRADGMPLRLNSKGPEDDIYGYFLGYVRDYLEEKYGTEMLYKGRLRVYTGLRRWAQVQASRVMREGLERYDMRRGWRGPVRHIDGLDPQKEIKSLVSGKGLSSLKGKRLEGTVLRVYKGRAILKVNGAYAVLKKKDASWARRRYDRRKKRPRIIKGFNLRRILSVGDVVYVRVREIRDGVARVSLVQVPLVEGALVCLEPSSGRIEAMVGGYSFRKSQFNRAVAARRQAGSAFKPFLFALAFDKGLTPATIVRDEPVRYPTGSGGFWRPVNYDRKYHGPVTLREALVKSLNVSAVRLAEKIGIGEIVGFTRRLGLGYEIPEDLSIALGSLTVSPLELAAGYTIFVNGGKKVRPLSVLKVVDPKGNVLEDNGPESFRVISPGAAFLVTDILKDVIRRGTGRKASGLLTDSAGKTGTTDDFHDSWFVGYTPELLAAVWVGYDKGGSPLGYGMSGGAVAAPMWLDFMRAVTGNKRSSFSEPPGIVRYYVDRRTGKRVLFPSGSAYREYFIEGTEPGFKSISEIKRFFKKVFGGKGKD